VLQQRIHRHHEEACHGADRDQQGVDERHARHEKSSRRPPRPSRRRPQHVHGAPQGNEASRDHRAERNAHRRDALEERALVERQAEMNGGPLQHQELQGRSRSPESVVTESEICPSLSFHNAVKQM